MPLLPFRRTWLMMFTPPVPQGVWVAGLLPLNVRLPVPDRAMMTELMESPFSPVPGAALTANGNPPGGGQLVVAAPATPAAAAVAPPAFAVLARVLLIRGLSESAPT